ncbi:MAG TPA: phosphoadenylyl-sulfate reductase [Acidimicrobiales bacterium]|nr:phosphoadenylyl-sulfate reductase [Acidimicrobiales bacterium]
MSSRAVHLEEELADLSRSFESAPASKIVRWAVDRFHPRLSLLSSMTDALLVDLAVRVEPSIEVVFIDTGHHFPETLETVDLVRRKYGLNLRLVTVGPDPAPLGADGCCSATKVLQLDRALVGREAWMSGLRRADAATRADAPIVSLDRRGLVKVNPLATWSDDDVAGYIAEHDVPVNPLVFRGYLSVGCRPCTQPVAEGAAPRSGRWAGSSRTECGLHG